MVYVYGMRLRGFSVGTAPTKGIIRRKDDKSGKYWDILEYSRKLSETEVNMANFCFNTMYTKWKPCVYLNRMPCMVFYYFKAV